MNLRIYVEVQVLITVQQVTENLQDFVPYFDCNKLNCFLYNWLIRTYGFAIRGCYKKLYEKWTVLNDSGFLVQPAKQPRLVSALKTVFDEFIQIIRTLLNKTMLRIAESLAGYIIDINTNGYFKHFHLKYVRY